MSGEYDDHARAMRDKLNAVSPSLCIAKWAQVSINLPSGLTQSCYHPPALPIPLTELNNNPSALHNTVFKIHERKQMLAGERPAGCSYCWKIEDAGDHISDRSYRSSEWWAAPEFDTLADTADNATPRYVEVNFNQACNFKCMYCSPHLSTTWEEEIRKFGPYEMAGFKHNDITALECKGIMPLKVANKDNPYVQAFWEWWPTIYRKLRVFRMTGGEPLMDKNTFKVLEYVNEHPHGQLELSITSNLCPPDQKLFDKFVTAVQKLEQVREWDDPDNINDKTGEHHFKDAAIRHVMLFVSLDSVGKQAEYIRTGLHYDTLLANVRRYLTETNYSSVSFINTFNILSIPGLHGFLSMILALRKEFGGASQTKNSVKFQRVWFDIPLLNYPPWLSVQISTATEINEVKRCIQFMKDNVQEDDYLETLTGFKPYEILKVERDLAIMEKKLPAEEIVKRQSDFYTFISEYDARRGDNFVEVFPELRDFYVKCMKATIKGNR